MALLDDLNPQQQEAVLATKGPVLVLAGAGSGKTRVITYRVAYLVEQGVPGEALLAVTFTNKAADQMKERVAKLLAPTGRGRHAAEPWISTFHSFCARLLRAEGRRVGLRPDFPIYDEEDQLAAVKLALHQLGHDDRGYPPRSLLARISHAKNHAQGPDQFAAEAGDEAGRMAAEIFRGYEAILRKAGAADFDDLLLRGVELLREHPECRVRWSQRFRYVHVDEFQDTNRLQYELLRLLAGEPESGEPESGEPESGEQKNLCVVGDEDQSIYGWRGADVGNILHFSEDFPGTRVVRLEQNYRSTQRILDAAGAVVAHNVRRLGLSLRATRGPGTNLCYCEARDARAEAEYVADEIARVVRNDRDAPESGTPESGGPAVAGARCAVLYRTNAQSRAFEEALRDRRLRYRVIGGFSFYQRAEVKDLLAYVRLALNPEDDVALLRVLNTPPRGIGGKTVEALQQRAHARGVSLWAALKAWIEAGERPLPPLRDFRELVEDLRGAWAQLPPVEFLRHALERTGYLEYAEQRDAAEHTSRAENLAELVNAVAEGGEALEDFLDRAALTSEADDYDEHAPISLMTLHSAKGLEFEHVFLTGLEEGLFPHARARDRQEDLEEERRLCYVGMTRAKNSLTLTRALYRRSYATNLAKAAVPSRFLKEIPGEWIETVPGSLAGPGETRRYEPDDEYTGRQLVGLRVRHPTYGLGTIIGVDGEGEDRKLTVSFYDYGTRKLVERYAQLEPA